MLLTSQLEEGRGRESWVIGCHGYLTKGPLGTSEPCKM